MATETKPIDLDKLKPGPEMDALVARAIGCDVQRKCLPAGLTEWICDCFSGEHGRNDAQGLKPYSTDMNAAWEAMEAAGWDSYRWSMQHVIPGTSGNLGSRYYDVLVYSLSGQQLARTTDPTASMAICLAILTLKAAE